MKTCACGKPSGKVSVCSVECNKKLRVQYQLHYMKRLRNLEPKVCRKSKVWKRLSTNNGLYIKRCVLYDVPTDAVSILSDEERAQMAITIAENCLPNIKSEMRAVLADKFDTIYKIMSDEAKKQRLKQSLIWKTIL